MRFLVLGSGGVGGADDVCRRPGGALWLAERLGPERVVLGIAQIAFDGAPA